MCFYSSSSICIVVLIPPSLLPFFLPAYLFLASFLPFFHKYYTQLLIVSYVYVILALPFRLVHFDTWLQKYLMH